jgi:hypothetical protein
MNIKDKKVRYSDYILMLRQSEEKSITSPEVLNDVLDSNFNMQDLSLLEFQGNLIPMTLKITKAKEGVRGDSKYMIFSPYNLRIYDNFNEVAADMIIFKQNSVDFLKDIEGVGLIIDDSELIFSDENIDPLENILI